VIYGALAVLLLVIFTWRSETKIGPGKVGGDLELERLRIQLEVEVSLKEQFREAFLRQKALYERDLQAEQELKEQFKADYLRQKALCEQQSNELQLV
jgi:hypothetical protein